MVVCAFSELPRRAEARSVRTLGDSRLGQVLGREAAGRATSTAEGEAATVAEALLLDGEPLRASPGGPAGGRRR